jgi:hypothetical protein
MSKCVKQYYCVRIEHNLTNIRTIIEFTTKIMSILHRTKDFIGHFISTDNLYISIRTESIIDEGT